MVEPSSQLEPRGGHAAGVTGDVRHRGAPLAGRGDRCGVAQEEDTLPCLCAPDVGLLHPGQGLLTIDTVTKRVEVGDPERVRVYFLDCVGELDVRLKPALVP